MIEQWNLDRTRYATFSEHYTDRYNLNIAVSERARASCLDPNATPLEFCATALFIMCNPSVADAMKPDPTSDKCISFGRVWNADFVEIVNLCSMISTYPADLKRRAVGARGDDVVNDQVIKFAALRATKIICAWGNHGQLDGRDRFVHTMLVDAGHRPVLFHLGLTDSGAPKHPLARGKHFIPLTREPEPFTWAT